MESERGFGVWGLGFGVWAQILNDYLRAYLNVTLKTFDLLYKSMGTGYEIHY
jgi:hypothetical protein